MIRADRGEGRIIAASLLLAFLLSALPFPPWASAWQPAWVALAVVFWCMVLPERVGILSAWALGLVLDALKGTLLGQHAAALAIAAYLTVAYNRRLRVFPLFQQSLFVGLMVAIDALIATWVRGISGLDSQQGAVWLPVLSSILLCPWAFLLLHDLRRRCGAQ
ncbi:MAG: rod shape-determining protein MreD [Gammaproteobacteria bacterium]